MGVFMSKMIGKCLTALVFTVMLLTVSAILFDTGQASALTGVDGINPTISITSPSNNTYNNTGSVTLQWVSADLQSGLAHHEITMDDGPILTVPSDVQSLPLNHLSNGSHNVTVVAFDNAGNHDASSVTFTVDMVGPAVSITHPTNGSYCNASVDLQWTSSDPLSGIAFHEIQYDSGPVLTVPSDVRSLLKTGLTDGNHTVKVIAYDNAGNHNSSSSSFVVSTTGPVITTLPASPIYSSSFAEEFRVYITDAVPMTTANISEFSNGESRGGGPIFGMADQTSFSYFVLLHLEQGVNTYRVTVNDSAGNSRSMVATVYRDNTPPTISITSPANHAYNNTGSMTVTWAGTDGLGIDHYEIFVNGGKVATYGAGNSTAVVSLPEGNGEIMVYAYDRAGNSAYATVHVIVDLTGPIVEISSPYAGQITLSSVTVYWSGADPLSGIARYVVSMDGGAGTELSASTLSYGFAGLASGSHTVMVKAYDNTGNSFSDSVTFVVDIVSPSITSETMTGDIAEKNIAIVVGFSEAMNQTSTTITVDGVEGTVSWSGNNATFTPSSVLAYGTPYIVTVSGHDSAGNSVTSTGSFATPAAPASITDGGILAISFVLLIVALGFAMIVLIRRSKK